MSKKKELIFCDNCQEIIEFDVVHISNNNFCSTCFHKFMFSKCSDSYCDNVVSLNGYDSKIDIEDNTCHICKFLFCNDCINIINSFIICNECSMLEPSDIVSDYEEEQDF